MSVELCPERSFDVRMTHDAGQVLLVKFLNAFELDEVGASIWNACDGRRTIDDIAALVAAEYDVDLTTARADVAEFVATLRSAQLLEA
jgi:hypothetical protein